MTIIPRLQRLQQNNMTRPPINRRVTNMTPFLPRRNNTRLMIMITPRTISLIMTNRRILEVYFFCASLGSPRVSLPRNTNTSCKVIIITIVFLVITNGILKTNKC